MGCFFDTRPFILLIYYHQAAISAKKYHIEMFSSEINETDLKMFYCGPYTKLLFIYSTETVVSSAWFSYFPAMIFLSFGIYNFFLVCIMSEHLYSEQLNPFIT